MVRFPSFGPSKAYAEYVSVPASEVALKPTGIDHVHAAGAPMSLLTAWQFMIELGHNEPNPLQPNMHEPVPLGVYRRFQATGDDYSQGDILIQHVASLWQAAPIALSG